MIETTHKLTTPHGFRTRHKFPSEINLDLQNFGILSSQLYPTGRAWYGQEGGVFEKLHGAVNLSFSRTAYIAQLPIRFPFGSCLTPASVKRLKILRLGIRLSL